MRRNMWFPTMWHFENCRLKWACAANSKALIRLCVCAGWFEALLVAHTTLLEISCRGSYKLTIYMRFWVPILSNDEQIKQLRTYNSSPSLTDRVFHAISVNKMWMLHILYYIPINDTSFELSVFWLSDTESRINKLRFSDSVLIILYTRLTSVTCFCGDVTLSKFQAWNQRQKTWWRNFNKRDVMAIVPAIFRD